MPQLFDPNEPLNPEDQIALLSQAAYAQPQADQFNFQSRAQAIEARKRALADAMRRRAGATNAVSELPSGRIVGNKFVGPHWTEMLNAALQPMFAQQGVASEEKALKQQTEEYERADQEAAAAHQARMPRSREVSRELPGPTEDEQPLIGTQTVKPTRDERLKWAQEGQRIPSRKEVMSRLIDDLLVKEPEREELRQFRKEDREDRQAARREEFQATLDLKKEQLQEQIRQAQEREKDARLNTAERERAHRATEDLKAQLLELQGNKSRRETIEDAVKKAEAVEEAKVRGREKAKEEASARTRARDATDSLSAIDRVDEILKAGPTGSYIGKAVDEAGRAFGVATPGAEKASSLKVLSGELVSKMPKMSGPQSDRDVLLYREMAGQVGDDTLPVGTRQAAAKEVRRLQEKYKDQNPDATKPSVQLNFSDIAGALPQLAKIPDPAERQAVIEQFNKQYGPVKVQSPEEARQLPPGTKFVTPDGRIKVR